MHVERDVLPARARGIHEFDAARSVIVAAARPEVRNLQLHARPLADAQRFGDRLHRAGVTLARMRGVQRTVARAFAAEGDQFVLGRAGFGRIFEPDRIAERALLQSLAQEARHFLQPVGISRLVTQAECGETQLPIRHERQHVDGRLRGGEPVEILAQRAPAQRDGVVETVDSAGRERRIADRPAAIAAIADHLGGDALHERGDGARIDQQRVVGMAVDVDEARRNGEAGRVDRGLGFALDFADGGDAAVLDAHVGGSRRRAGAVDQGAVADEYV